VNETCKPDLSFLSNKLRDTVLYPRFRSRSVEKLTLKQLNELQPSEFHELFVNVVEHWSQAAIFVSALLPFKTYDQLFEGFNRYLDKLSTETKVNVLRQYPDLAGKLCDNGMLSHDSQLEHETCGLDKLVASQKQTLTQLNESYKHKFGIPFVICVRENKFESILSGLQQRINNTKDQEIEIEMAEVKKICRLRICQIVDYTEDEE
jgi:2-oxo-4-hydroxy-4-carboxy-5-ureidoimidazoline decarboxylase